MFRIKRSFTAMMLAAAMVFGSTAASAETLKDAADDRAADDRAAKVTTVQTFTENGDEVEVTVDGDQAIVVYKGKLDRSDDYFSADDDVAYGWVQVAIRVAVGLFELLNGEGGSTGGDEAPKGSGKESGSGNSGGSGAGGTSSGCSTTVNNFGSGTVIVSNNNGCSPT